MAESAGKPRVVFGKGEREFCHFARAAEFRGPIEEQIYGRIIMLIVPGADDLQLYQPTHRVAYDLG